VKTPISVSQARQISATGRAAWRGTGVAPAHSLDPTLSLLQLGHAEHHLQWSTSRIVDAADIGWKRETRPAAGPARPSTGNGFDLAYCGCSGLVRLVSRIWMDAHVLV
jgi:hypothetical protein